MVLKYTIINFNGMKYLDSHLNKKAFIYKKGFKNIVGSFNGMGIQTLI